MTDCYIGLGSNLADPIKQIEKAIFAIKNLCKVHALQSSSLFSSSPMGPKDQPDYVNAVIKIDTSYSPLELLDHLQFIENQHGRDRAKHWGARTLDLDILLFGDLEYTDERLTIPHYGIKQRDFVLVPLAELSANLILPSGESIQQLIDNCESHKLEKLVISV